MESVTLFEARKLWFSEPKIRLNKLWIFAEVKTWFG